MTDEHRYVHLVSEDDFGGGTFIELVYDEVVRDWRAHREITLGRGLQPVHRTSQMMGWWAESGLVLSDWEEQPQFSVTPISEDDFDAQWDKADRLGLRVVDGAGIPWGSVLATVLVVVVLPLAVWGFWRLLRGASDVVTIFVISIVGFLMVDSAISYRRREAPLSELVAVGVLELAFIMILLAFFGLFR